MMRRTMMRRTMMRRTMMGSHHDEAHHDEAHHDGGGEAAHHDEVAVGRTVGLELLRHAQRAHDALEAVLYPQPAAREISEISRTV